jgi:hypothetical protein
MPSRVNVFAALFGAYRALLLSFAALQHARAHARLLD